MEVAGLGLAVFSAAALCLRIGKVLADRYKAFNDADEEIERTLLVVRYLWFRIKCQLEVIKNMSHDLDEAYQVLQNQTLGVLRTKLEKLDSKLERYSELPPDQRKLKFASKEKDSLQDSITDLENWYRRWDPSWLILTRLANAKLDAEIRQQSAAVVGRQTLSIVNGLRVARRAMSYHTKARPDLPSFMFLSDQVGLRGVREIQYSPASIRKRSDTGDYVIIDTVDCQPGIHERDTWGDIQDLASILSKVDPVSCSLLACDGIKKGELKTGDPATYSFIFQMPPSGLRASSSLIQPPDRPSIDPDDILSLRGQLVQHPTASLSFRLAVTRSLARSIISLHSGFFVHKNIRPETILTTPSGVSYLVGFQRFRSTATDTYRQGDGLWQHNIYRHPLRQGSSPQETFTLQHDVYSFGVCLLEIGLWTSFVNYDETGKVATCGLPEIAVVPKVRDNTKRALAIKRIYLDLAENKLRHLAGDKYADVVVACLTYSDRDGGDHGNGIQVGVRYLEQIFNKIEDISV